MRDARSDPSGLLLGTNDGLRAQVLSLYVRPDQRRGGSGVALLDAFASASARLALQEMWAEYTSTLPQRLAFERCLEKAGWEPPRVRESRLSGRITDWLAARQQWPGLERSRDLRADIAFACWREGFDTTEAVRLLEQQRGFHPGLSPSRHAGSLDLATSLAILQQDRIVGWALAGRPQHGADGRCSVRWPAAYVSEELWKTGVLIRACWHSLALAAERYGPDVTAIFYTALPGIRAMAKRRLAHVSVVTEIVEVRKQLVAECPGEHLRS